MSFRMSKSVVLFAFVLMALPVLAFAQTSRLEGMTLQGDYVKDYTNIYGYPSQVANVGNLAYGELGNTFGVGTGVVDRGFGSVIGNLMEGRTGAWAIHLRELSPQLGTGDNSSVNSADPNFNMNEEFDLMWAKKAGTTSFGLRLNRSFWGSTVSPPSPGVQTKLKFDPTAGATAADSNARNLSRNTYGFGGGVGFEMNPNTSVEIGRKEVEVAQLRYERGLSNNLDVVTAESNLLTAESRRIATLADSAVARLSLRAMLGILDPRKDVK